MTRTGPQTPVGRNTGRVPPVGSGRQAQSNIEADREKLGLSTQKPSEMIAGLEEVAKRAEKAEQRELAKQKAGGKMAANEALHVDDTGAKIAWKVRLALFGTIFAVIGLGVFFVYRAMHPPIDNRVAYDDTRRYLDGLRGLADETMFKPGEQVSAQEVRKRLTERIDARLKELDDQAKKNKESKRPPDSQNVKQKNELEQLRTFKDAWGGPIEINVEGDFALFGAKSKGAKPIDPVKSRVKADKAK